MTKTNAHIAFAVTAMLAISGAAYAAGGATDTSESPQRAGEMSTMTNGVPNQETTNSPYGDHVNQGGRVANTRLTASETSDAPLRAGEATTMTRGAPNVSTNNRVDSVSLAGMTTTTSTAMGASSIHFTPFEVQAP